MNRLCFRIGVSFIVAIMLGLLFIQAGNEGSRVLDNYNLLFGILIHHMMTTKMLTILTCRFNSLCGKILSAFTRNKFAIASGLQNH